MTKNDRVRKAVRDEAKFLGLVIAAVIVIAVVRRYL